MAYADGKFYEEVWGSGTIPAGELPAYLNRASMEVDTLTFGRLRKGLPEDAYAAEKIHMAVCCGADILYMCDLAEKQAGEAVRQAASGNEAEREVKAVSDGTESITYVTGGELSGQAGKMSAVLSESGRGREKLLRDRLRYYLSDIRDRDGINLLYAGI